MTTDKLICAIRSGKYEGAIFVVYEVYLMESRFLAKLFIRIWFNLVNELEEYLYLHALLFLIEFLDFAGLGGLKGCCSDTGYMLPSGREGAAPLIVQMEKQIVRRLGGGNLRHYCIQEPALCIGGSIVVWVGIHKGGKTSLVALDGNVNAFM